MFNLLFDQTFQKGGLNILFLASEIKHFIKQSQQ